MTRIRKAAKANGKSDGPHELTNMEVQEVSVVDRAANQRKFLVTKADEAPAGAVASDEDDIVLNGSAGDDPASRLDAADAAKVGKSDAQKALDAKDAADQAEYLAAKARLEKEQGGSAASASPKDSTAPVAASVADASAQDAVKALDQLAAEVGTGASGDIKKDDPVAVVVVTPGAGTNPTAEKVKAAILAGIDEIAAKVGQWRAAIEASDEKNTDQISGRPWAVWEYSYYIERMIGSISNIGGPDWEMLNATIGKEISAEIELAKSAKAITIARVGTLKGIHKGMAHCTESMGKLMKDFDDAPSDVQNSDASFAKAAPVAVPVAATPPVDAATIAKVAELEGVVKTLTDMVSAQSERLKKREGEVSSNAIVGSQAEIVRKADDGDKIDWPGDLAPPRGQALRRSRH